MSALATLLLASAVLAVAALPGIVVAAQRGERLALGATLSLALHSLCLSYAPAVAGLPLLTVSIVLVIVIVIVIGRSDHRLPLPRFRPLEGASVLLVASTFSVLVLQHRSPRGWDPSFHCLLVSKLSSGVRPATWEPWEPVSVHYTLGADALVAHVARAAHLAPHEAFEASFPFAYLLVAWTALGAFRRATRSRLAALFGTLALGLLAGEIRLVYHWGGLPTVLGLAIALAAGEARTWPLAGLLLGTLPHFHHLSALIAWSAAGVLALTLRSRAIGKALLLAGLLALPLVPSVLSALHDAGSTSILRFADEPRRTAWEYVLSAHHWGWGPALLVLALAAVFRPRHAKPALAVFSAFFVVHVLLDVVYRAVALHLTGEAFSALTPSRWFQLASVPLAALAGLGVTLLPRRLALLGCAIVVVLALPSDRWEYDTRGLDPDLFQVAKWARERLPEDALVLVRVPSRYWWPYLLDRETDETPLPASEPRRDPRVLAKKGLAQDPVAARAFARGRGKKLFWLRPSSEPPASGARRKDTWQGVVALDEDAP